MPKIVDQFAIPLPYATGAPEAEMAAAQIGMKQIPRVLAHLANTGYNVDPTVHLQVDAKMVFQILSLAVKVLEL